MKSSNSSIRSIKIWKKPFKLLLKKHYDENYPISYFKNKSPNSGLILSITLFLSLFFSFTSSTPAQGIAVYDNTNFISLTKQLTEAGKQTSNMMQMVSFLKEQKQNLEQVNTLIKELRAAREITRNNTRMVNMVNRELRDILESPYIHPEEIKVINDSFQLIIDHSLATLDFVNQVLSSYRLKMSDAERARTLQEKQIESREMVAQVRRNTKRYQEIIAFREFQDHINNRNTGY